MTVSFEDMTYAFRGEIKLIKTAQIVSNNEINKSDFFFHNIAGQVLFFVPGVPHESGAFEELTHFAESLNQGVGALERK